MQQTIKQTIEQTHRLLELLGHGEMPFGVTYSDSKPDGFGPKPGELFSREREARGEIDWRKVSDNFSCLVGNIWLARKKRKAAWISHEECGCMGGGFYSGMYTPWLETNIFFVSTGIPGTTMEGEHYLPSPESMRAFMAEVSPPPAPKRYCVLRPLDQFAEEAADGLAANSQEGQPLVVVFFARPEVITGLSSLVHYATGDPHAVASPFGSGCSHIIAWPLAYQLRGETRAVLGGFDPSARKFLKTDELSFAVPWPLYRQMLDAMEDSALVRHTWEGTRKKVLRSQRAWGEEHPA